MKKPPETPPLEGADHSQHHPVVLTLDIPGVLGQEPEVPGRARIDRQINHPLAEPRDLWFNSKKYGKIVRNNQTAMS